MNKLKRIFMIQIFVILLMPLPSGKCQDIVNTPIIRGKDLDLTIVYDNNLYDNRLETRWGFSCYIKGTEKTILFDVGGDGSVLLGNMEKLEIDPKTVNAIVLSHIHYDHIGGLSNFLQENCNVTVYMPRSLPESVRNQARLLGARIVDVQKPVKICNDVYSTGELGTFIKEQSLVIKTSKGLVLITGCAHPGISNIVKRSKEMLKSRVYLALGGFHLCWMSLSRVNKIIKGVKEEGVKKVAPCHCSGDLARRQFQEAYGKNFILTGAGKTIKIKNAF